MCLPLKLGGGSTSMTSTIEVRQWYSKMSLLRTIILCILVSGTKDRQKGEQERVRSRHNGLRPMRKCRRRTFAIYRLSAVLHMDGKYKSMDTQSVNASTSNRKPYQCGSTLQRQYDFTHPGADEVSRPYTVRLRERVSTFPRYTYESRTLRYLGKSLK